MVDALRGFALLAILIANIPYAAGSEAVYKDRVFIIGSCSIDEILNFLFHLFIDKKFVAIFSMLFGFGFYVQLKRAESQQIQFKLYFIRRMLLLLVIGCLHAYLFWYGDIIRNYAICGMFLLFVYRWKPKNIIRLGIFFAVFLTGLVFIANGIMGLQYPYNTAIIAEHPVTQSFLRYLQINFTIDPFVNFVQDSPLTLVFAFGTMLIGFGMAKSGFFHRPTLFTRLINTLIICGLVAGLACSYLFWKINRGTLEITPALLWLPFIIIAGMLSQSLGYISAFAKLFQRPGLQRTLSVFEPVGRMALTNYLLQTVFYVLVFFHWSHGLQLYGKLTLAETYILAVMLFALQVLASRWWLKTHKQGPVETIWKRLSYKHSRLTNVSEGVLKTRPIFSEQIRN